MISRRLSILVLGLLPFPAIEAQTPRPSESLQVHGAALASQRVFSPGELAAFVPEAVETFEQSRGGERGEQRTSARGARLAAIVSKLGLTPAAKADWKNVLVTVTATDGYRAQFTWAELTNTPTGERALVIFERDGKPLDAREGKIAVISPGDFRLGARHVRNVLRVEVRQLSE